MACGAGATVAPAPATEVKPPIATTASAPPVGTEVSPPSTASTAPAKTLEAVAMLGPFKTLAEACKALASGSGKSKSKAIDCLPGATVASPPKGAAVDRAMLLMVSDKARPDWAVTHLALHVTSGWFADADGPESASDAAMMKRFHTDVLPEGNPSFAAIPGTTFAARYDFTEVTVVVEVDPAAGKKSNPHLFGVRGTMVLCAVGPSGVPSCLDPIRTGSKPATPAAPQPDPDRVVFTANAAEWSIDEGAHLTMLRDAGHAETHEEVSLVGRYGLRFP